MAAYTPDKRGPQAGSGSYADIVASDAGNAHIIRTISIVNTSGSARTAYVSIGSGAAATLIVQVTIPAGETRVFNGWWHVLTSTVCQVKQDTGTDVTFTLSGYHYA